MTVTQLREKRAGLIADARKVVDHADAEKRKLAADEQQKIDGFFAESDTVAAEIKEIEDEQRRLDRLGKLEIGLDTPEERVAQPAQPQTGSDDPDNTRPTATPEYRAAFRSYMRVGKPGLSPDEVRALQVGTDSEGGYITFDEFESAIVSKRDEESVVRGLATVVTSSSGALKIPTETSVGAAAWDAEEAAYEEADDAFGQVTLTPYKGTRIIKVSEELVHDAFFAIEPYLAGSFARSFTNLEEAAFVNGNGSSKPTGVIVGSTLGVTAASATAVTADEVIGLFYAIKRTYARFGTWLMANGTVKAIRQLKGSDNNYLWQPGLGGGEPDLLLGRPIAVTDDAPAMTTGLKSIIFGDMSFYWIADRAGVSFSVLDQLYAASGQIGYKAAIRTDGELTQAEAVYHLIQA